MRFIQNSLAAAAVLLCLMSARGSAAQESLIYSFSYVYPGGAGPTGKLLMDAIGNLFGTTTGGGTDHEGTVFELSPVVGGGWAEKTIYNFTSKGESSYGGSLTSDGKGNLYGTSSTTDSSSGGAVYEISPSPDGTWTKKVLHSFPSNSADGMFPNPTLTFDSQGNLYGTTQSGGSHITDYCRGCGTAFELTPSAGGSWIEKVLYNFGRYGTNLILPSSGLTIDRNGILYGTTSAGADFGPEPGGGGVFELVPNVAGNWAEETLYYFNYKNQYGAGDLTLDNDGNLYGETGYGTIFELSPADAMWTEKDLYVDDGIYSATTLILDAQGNLYGTTNGYYSGGGSVFKLAPQPNGPGKKTILHQFPAYVDDGVYPGSGVTLDSEGNLYGVTSGGGFSVYESDSDGAVFEIAGVAVAPSVATTTAILASPSTNLVAGEPITLTATVTAASGPAIPSGTVTFTDPAGGSVKVLLIAGQAVYYGKVPPVGNYSVYASYSGDPRFGASTSTTINGTVTAQ